MSVKNFVCGSAVVLLGWLTTTFLREVPEQAYPRMLKSTASTENPAPSEISVAPASVTH
ncbi:MAG: hypothetical protein V4733_06285 [Verrucomicrobiota bacterium]